MLRRSLFLLPILALVACEDEPVVIPPLPPAPSVSGLAPQEGYAGDLVTISGSALGAGTSVQFDGAAAAVVTSAADKIVVRVPEDLVAESTVRVILPGAEPLLVPGTFHSLGQGAIRHQVVSEVVPLATVPRSMVVASSGIFARSETYGLLVNSGVAVPHYEGKLVRPVDVAGPADGSRVFALVADGDSGTLLRIDTTSEELPVTVVARGLPSAARLAVDADASSVFVAEAACDDCRLRAFSAATGALRWNVALAAPARRLFTAGNVVVAVSEESVEVFRLGAGAATSLGQLETPGGVAHATLDPNGLRVAVLDPSSRVWWHDVENAPELIDADGSSGNGLSPTLTHLTNAAGIACGDSCLTAYVTFPLEGRVILLAFADPQLQGAISVPGGVGEMVFSGGTLYVSTEDNSRAVAIDTTIRAVVDDQIFLNTGLRSIVAEDALGNLAAYAIYLDAVVRLTPSGRSVRSFTELTGAVDLECLDLEVLDKIPPVVSPGDGRLVVWRGRRVEVQAGTLAYEIDAGACIRRMVVAGGSGRLFLDTAQGVKAFDLGTGRLSGLVSFPGEVDAIAATPWGVAIGARLATGAEIFAMDASGAANPMKLSGELDYTTLLAPARGGSLFLAVGFGLDAEKYLYALDRSAGLVKKMRAGGAAGSTGPLLVSPSGRRMYSLSPGDTSTRLLSAAILTEPCCGIAGSVVSVELPVTSMVGFAQSPAGDRLYVLDEDKDRLVVVE